MKFFGSLWLRLGHRLDGIDQSLDFGLVDVSPSFLGHEERKQLLGNLVI
jgi:hypothetical protein